MRCLRSLGAATAFALVFAFVQVAQAEFFRITRYDVDITVNSDATLDIKEQIGVRFTSSRRGIFRKIPVRYRMAPDQGGERASRPLFTGSTYTIDLYDIDVAGETWKKSREGDDVVIRIGDADKTVSGEKTYTIRYRVNGGINKFADHAELYWNVIGTGWDVPIDAAAFYVFLPKEAAPAEQDVFVYTGGIGSRESNAVLAVNGNTLSGRITAPLGPREGVTVGLRMPKSLVDRGGAYLSLRILVTNNPIILLPFVVALVLWAVWWFTGRDERFIRTVCYKPPADISPAVAGALIDDTTDNRDLISLLFQWCAAGCMTIEETEEAGILLSKPDYILTKTAALPDTALPFEQTIFSGLFPVGMDSRRVSTLKNEFHETMKAARAQLDEYIANSGYYAGYSREFGGILKICGLVLGGGTVYAAFNSSIAATAALLCSGIITYLFGRVMPKRTSEGLRQFRILDGFRDFADRVEKLRLERLLKEDPRYFDRTLPYAVALGIADRWAAKFDDLLTEPPRWYAGHRADRFTASGFARSINTSVSTIGAVFASTPSNAGGGSSGFGGGGFSGGGMGGGGGSSW